MGLDAARTRLLEGLRHGIRDRRVLSAIASVPRELFILPDCYDLAYEDMPLSIGFGQTISQPYTVAFMTNLLGLKGGEKVLEIGTGSGYQAAVLSYLSGQVFTIEIIPELAERAKRILKRLAYQNIEVRVGTGELGWKEKAPFNAILVTAGMEWIPEELFAELKDGGVLVAPVGRGPDKVMTKYTKVKKRGKEEIKKEEFGIFHFVPFVESN